APRGVKFSADGKRLYIACYSDEVAVLELDAAGFPVTRIKIAADAGDAFTAVYQPDAVAVSPATGDVFISCLANGEVRVLSAATLMMQPSRTARVGGNPQLSDFSGDGSSLYVPHRADDRISVVNPSTGSETGLIAPPAASCL